MGIAAGCRSRGRSSARARERSKLRLRHVARLDLLNQLVLCLYKPRNSLLARLLQLPSQQELIQDEVGLRGAGAGACWDASAANEPGGAAWPLLAQRQPVHGQLTLTKAAQQAEVLGSSSPGGCRVQAHLVEVEDQVQLADVAKVPASNSSDGEDA